MKVQNLTIKFSHQRDLLRIDYIGDRRYPIYKEGGETHVLIEGPDIEIRAHSKCVKNDMYWKDKGRKIALKKALEGSTLSKDVKAEIWETYRTTTKVPRW